MKSIRFFSLLAIAASFLITGCASTAHVEKDDSVNFSNYKTYAWVESKSNQSDSARKPVSFTEQNIRKAVGAELAKEGFREVKNRPDLLISQDVLIERSVRNSTNPVYSNPYTRYLYNPYARRWVSLYYPSQFLGYDDREFQVREGTITITMVDAKTDKMVWQGWTTDEVNSRNLSNKEIQASVKSIFRKFDVAKN